ncbi:MAG: hypothetical protein KY439_02045 [Actinobacteria bacterium]|nr:hypothetical protein [Actinomycetota bacterium]
MMNLLYLGIAILLSIIGGLILWYRNRRPTSLTAGIEEFQRELRALTPDGYQKRDRGSGPTGRR